MYIFYKRKEKKKQKRLQCIECTTYNLQKKSSLKENKKVQGKKDTNIKLYVKRIKEHTE